MTVTHYTRDTSPSLTDSDDSISLSRFPSTPSKTIVALDDDTIIADIPKDLLLPTNSNNGNKFRYSKPPPSTAASDSALDSQRTTEFLDQQASANKRHPKKSSFNNATRKQPWKKLLWIKQDYDDNYTDTAFLSQLKRNSTVVNYSFWKLVQDFSLIVLHLSVIISVILVFYGIYQLNWNPITPTLISTSATVLCFIIYIITLKIQRSRELITLQKFKIEQLAMSTRNRRFNNVSRPTSRSSSPFAGLDNSSNVNLNNSNQNNVSLANLDLEQYLLEPNPPSLISTLKSSILILLSLLTFSPVLKSLTNSTASDSIWALSVWLCILNVFFHDYSIEFPNFKEQQLQRLLTNNNASAIAAVANGDLSYLELKYSNSNLAKNLSLSNAIVLASRLNSNLSAFCFILFSIQVSGLFPIFNNFTRRYQYWQFHWFQFVIIVFGVDYTIWKIFGTGWLLTWSFVHFLIVIAGPWYFIALQKYKDELQGPWDPAKPVVKSI